MDDPKPVPDTIGLPRAALWDGGGLIPSLRRLSLGMPASRQA